MILTEDEELREIEKLIEELRPWQRQRTSPWYRTVEVLKKIASRRRAVLRERDQAENASLAYHIGAARRALLSADRAIEAIESIETEGEVR